MNPTILLVAAAVTVTHPTEQEQAEAMAPFQECLNAQASQLEDGHTDIAVLGKAAADACEPQFEEMVTIASRNVSPENRAKLREALEWVKAGAGTVAIARIRYKK